ncbi:MAG: hypothetical protein DRN71_03765 [Candidatus Nanohalarchaeota archaeon]|nr:MAG: hypothetical protein DRN71_03765 [Candidatus Nanohaloarchaeota archaeon]
MNDVIRYLVENQNFITDRQTHSGKRVLAKIDQTVIGKTGYIEWNLGIYKNNERNTARLKVNGENKAIFVDEHMRYNRIGLNLTDILFDELTNDGYEQLIVLGVKEDKKVFYDKTFETLKASMKINFYNVEKKHFSSTFPSLEMTYFLYDVTI